MRKILFLSFMLALTLSIGAEAETPSTLKQAKELSAELKKPILLEFIHED